MSSNRNPAASKVTGESERAGESGLAADQAGLSWAGSGMSRVTTPASVAVLVVAAAGVTSAFPGRSAAVVGGAVAALAAAAASLAFIIFRRPSRAGPDLAAFGTIGLAGAALAGLLPNTPGFVLIYVALAGIGMRFTLWPALTAGLVLLAVTNLALMLSVKVSIAALASQDIGAAFVFAVGAFTRSARISQQQARDAQARAENLLSQLRASQAAQAEAAALTERARLAREIHDILAHALSGLVLSLDTMALLAGQADRDTRAAGQLLAQVARAQRMARDGLADTRRAISALRGDEMPGPDLLDRLVRDTTASTGIAAELTVAGQPRPLPPGAGLALFRTAQEALTNTARYAGPGARAELRLSYHSDAVELVIEDSGPAGERADGAAAGRGLTFGGYGLTGMRERAELLGGSLNAGPDGPGFGVRLRLPAPQAAPHAGPRAGPEPAPRSAPRARRAATGGGPA
jgi:signal transduction histidine kinase